MRILAMKEERPSIVVRKTGGLSKLHTPDLGQLGLHNKKYILTCDSLLEFGLTRRAHILHLQPGSLRQVH